jgi:hypothetical protein
MTGAIHNIHIINPTLMHVVVIPHVDSGIGCSGVIIVVVIEVTFVAVHTL